MKLKLAYLSLVFASGLVFAKSDYLTPKEQLTVVQICSQSSCAPALLFDAHVHAPTPDEFASKTKDLLPGTTILISGYGKDLFAGVKMGEIIRERQFNTRVGRLGAPNLDRTGFYKRPGVCLSACAMAFMGGVKRQVDSEDKIGVTAIEPNRANLSDEDLAKALANTQKYLMQMGINPNFFEYLKSLSDRKLHIIELDRAKSFGIINAQISK